MLERMSGTIFVNVEKQALLVNHLATSGSTHGLSPRAAVLFTPLPLPSSRSFRHVKRSHFKG